MARRRIYDTYKIPSSVVEVVKAVCADYRRRDLEMKLLKVEGDVLHEYMRLNGAVDVGLCEIEACVRMDMLDDVKNRRGYNASPISLIMSRNAYYNRKRKFIYDVAHELNLL